MKINLLHNAYWRLQKARKKRPFAVRKSLTEQLRKALYPVFVLTSPAILFLLFGTTKDKVEHLEPDKTPAERQPVCVHSNLEQLSPNSAAETVAVVLPKDPYGTINIPSNSPGIIPSNSPGIDPLIAEKGEPYFPSRIATGGKLLTRQMFISPETCKECHKDIYDSWRSSTMKHAWEDPIYRAILRKASEATKGAVDNFCIGCHSPIGLTTGTAFATDQKESENEKTSIADSECIGLTCEVCHTISHITGLGNGSFVLAPSSYGRPVKFGPRGDARSPYHDTAYSELHTRSEFCATCHNVTHPFNRLAVERTYDEWRDSWYNGAGITCQECHMVPDPGQGQRSGKSALDGKERPNVYSHTFIGANATLHTYFNDEQMVEKDKRMLQLAATIKFVDPVEEVYAGQEITLQVRVDNVGAGHKLPTGFPEGREVWVDFQVKDRSGGEVYRLGAIKDGGTEAGTKSFKAILGDRNGNVVDLNVWEADRVLSDTRILPKGFARVEYTFMVPLGTVGDLTVVADLKYASFPQHILDELFGKDKIVGQIVLMGSAEHKIRVKGIVAGSSPENKPIENKIGNTDG